MDGPGEAGGPRETAGAAPTVPTCVSNFSSSGRVYPVAAQDACGISGLFQVTLVCGSCLCPWSGGHKLGGLTLPSLASQIFCCLCSTSPEFHL